MKKVCISLAVFLGLFMTGCETYEDNLKTALTTTEGTTEVPSAFDEVTEADSIITTDVPQVSDTFSSEEIITSIFEETGTETGLESINLNYEAIATATDVSDTGVSGSDTGETTSAISNQYTSEDGRPPLPDDLKDLYTSALEV